MLTVFGNFQITASMHLTLWGYFVFKIPVSLSSREVSLSFSVLSLASLPREPQVWEAQEVVAVLALLQAVVGAVEVLLLAVGEVEGVEVHPLEEGVAEEEEGVRLQVEVGEEAAVEAHPFQEVGVVGEEGESQPLQVGVGVEEEEVSQVLLVGVVEAVEVEVECHVLLVEGAGVSLASPSSVLLSFTCRP